LQGEHSGYKFPTKKVIVNLAPANLRKEGAAIDLPIALAILAVSGEVSEQSLEGLGVIGELSLDGGLRGIRGALSMAEGNLTEGRISQILHQALAKLRETLSEHPQPSGRW
jgi:magnesium chelatase family protein